MAKCWAWKDELPERDLASVGKHLGRWSALIAPRLLPALYALTGRSGHPEDFREGDLTPLQLEVAEAALAEGPSTGPELRALVGADKKQVDAAVVVLQRALVLTNAGVVEQKQGWNAIAVDLLARRWDVSNRPKEGRGAVRARGRCPGFVEKTCRQRISAERLAGASNARVRRSTSSSSSGRPSGGNSRVCRCGMPFPGCRG